MFKRKKENHDPSPMINDGPLNEINESKDIAAEPIMLPPCEEMFASEGKLQFLMVHQPW